MILRRLTGGAVAACLGMSLLAGCSAAPDLDGGVAAQLQQRVAAAKQLAAGQDFAAALAELDQLRQDVAAAAQQGQVSETRKTRIDTAISAVRSDLEGSLAPAPAPTAPAAEPPLTEEQLEQAEEARQEAEEQREDAQKEAQKQREEAQKKAEKQRNGG